MAKNTHDLDLAFDGERPKYLTEAEKWAWSVIFGEMEGRKYNWTTCEWEDPKEK